MWENILNDYLEEIFLLWPIFIGSLEHAGENSAEMSLYSSVVNLFWFPHMMDKAILRYKTSFLIRNTEGHWKMMH